MMNGVASGLFLFDQIIFLDSVTVKDQFHFYKKLAWGFVLKQTKSKCH